MLDVSRAHQPARQLFCRACVVLAVSLVGCGNQDQPATSAEPGSAGAAGAEATGSGGGASVASNNASTSSSGTTITGSGGTTVAGSGGAAGMPGDTEVTVSSSSTGSSDVPPEVVDLCVRLTNASGLAGALAIDFDTAVDQDCRVGRFPFLYVLETSYERPNFLNALARFNMALWGCSSALPSEFGLIYLKGLIEDSLPVTPLDAEALIEDYLAVAGLRLGLSPEEADSLEAYLEWLAQSVVSEDATGYSRSTCATGGAGGQAGGPN